MKKKLLTFFIAAVTAVCVTGCGGGGSSSSSSNTPTEETTPTTTVAGTASKGILIGATVTVYPLVDGVVNESAPLGNATTDAEGDYSIELDEDYDGGPIVVRITPAADNSTVMKCDVPAGCGNGIAFGGEYPITDAGFSLQAILSEAEAGEIAVNITPLTDLATGLALNSMLTASTAPSKGTVQAAIEIAKSQIANRFGITGDVNEIPVVDITEPESLKAANEEAVRYNSLSAAIVAAVNADAAQTLSVEAAIALFADAFLESGLSDRTAQADVTSLEEILEAAQAALAAAENLDSTLDLSDATTKLAAAAGIAAQGEVDQPSQGTASGTAAAEDLVKVKAFVQELRDLSTGASLSEAIDGTQITHTGAAAQARVDLTGFGKNAQAFQEQLEAVENFDTNAGDLLRAVGLVVNAMVEASAAREKNETLESYTDDNGIDIGISSGADGVLILTCVDTVTLDDEAQTSVGVNLTGTHNYSSGRMVNTSLNISLEGSATSNLLSLEIESGSASATLSKEVVTDSFTLSGVVLDLDVTLEELNEDLFTFTGTLDASLDNLSYSDSTGDSADSYTLNFGKVSFSLSGEFSNAEGVRFNASLALEADGTGVTLSHSEEGGNGETAENYVDFNFSLSFTISVAGVTNDTEVVVFSLSGTRTGLETGEIDITIVYPGVQINAEVTRDGTTDTITITNQDEVIAVVTAPEEGEFSGNITLDGAIYASIEDKDGDAIVRYIDGTIESL